MSDYQYDADYGDDYQYEEPMDQEYQQQDIEATIQIDYFNAEQFIRQGDNQNALKAFEDIYAQAETHNLRNWKVKTISQILQIHTQNGKFDQAKKSLQKIRKVNESDKLTQTAVKSIIMILQKCPRNQYQSYWKDLFVLIECLDTNGTLKSYIIMLEKQIFEGFIKNADQIYLRLKDSLSNLDSINPGIQLEIYYLEIKYLKMKGKDIGRKLKNIQMKLPYLQEQTHINDSHISYIKEEIAGILYEQGNYKQCANYLCSSFCQNAKFGKQSQRVKEMLKINILVLMLCQDEELVTKKDYNPMLHESTSSFKMDQDIQALFGLMQAFKNLDIKRFEQIYNIVCLKPQKNSSFSDIYQRVLFQLKKKKVLFITKPYNKITFDYIKQRIRENEDSIVQIFFQLINQEKINGCIHLQQKYVQIRPELSPYFKIQLQNLKELTSRL